MLVSLNWLRDFVALPADLDPHVLAEQFTVTTAEVEGIHEITCEAAGLVAAEILQVEPLPDRVHLCVVRLNAGAEPAEIVTAATGLEPGQKVIFAPPGATLPVVGQVTRREVAGRTSAGMIVPGDALGLATVGQRAVWLPPSTPAGEPIDLELFHDWVMEIDNKSITNRPDLWGHYGIARELAAAYGLPLADCPMTPRAELEDPALPVIPIEIDDPAKCPRYTALRFVGVRSLPSPLWMQARLAHVGQRPINLMVDLTNYIMLELGQPMHAFDGADVDRIEVALAQKGEKFTTLDGVERLMPEGAVMIQCRRKSIALAGIMGGASTEVTERTESLLLESANFEPATIRRCATALGHRTDASARFEKSQDSTNTVLSIQRFVHLARQAAPDLRITGRLSDCFPKPPPPIVVTLQPAKVCRYMGRSVSDDEIRRILEPLGFTVKAVGGDFAVTVPSYRATKDISIQEDLIEEVARFLGYASIEPRLPVVTVRYAEPAPDARLERASLRLLCGGLAYAEVHRPVWFDAEWLRRLGFDAGPTVTLRNPVAAGAERLRTTLIPGLLAAVDLNRHQLERFDLLEIGSVFALHSDDETEHRRMGMVLVAPGRKPAHDDELLRRLKVDVETWARQMFQEAVVYRPASASAPWEHAAKTAEIHISGQPIGRLTAVPGPLKRGIDEHLAAWAIAVAELDLHAALRIVPAMRKLAPIPVYPQVQLDFSLLVDSSRRYGDLSLTLKGFEHPLLRRLAFVDSFEGGSVPAGKRSVTFRATLGDAQRTLTDDDSVAFRTAFIGFLEAQGLSLRT